MEEIHFIRDFALIMAAAGVALVLFRRINQPPILGYLIAGVVLSPFNLPAIVVGDLETVKLLADLGLLVLLFALGLEFGWQRIRRLGFSVVFIGMIEITVMIALGYAAGIALGWTDTEAIFLGSALCISSSAVLSKVLRDEGKLYESFGQLIIGILVVEDFAAVVLLSLLSAVASTGAAELTGLWPLIGKLAIFTASALLFGGLLAPRLITYVGQFRSQEILLVTSLALCFGLALVAHQMGISAAAGAFLIGAVLGDTEQSEEITHTVSPLRDMFSGLFFVSIGMLVDLSLVIEFLVPAAIITTLFVLGKVVADTLGSFLAGNDERTAVRVGMGMPQMGEFSLAMVKVGADHGAVGTFLYPVIAVVTVLTSFLYPFIFRATEAVVRLLERLTPPFVRQALTNRAAALAAYRESTDARGERNAEARGVTRGLLIYMGLVLVVVTTGTVLLRFAVQISRYLGIDPQWVGLLIAGSVLALCLPSAVGLWRGIGRLSDILYDAIVQKFGATLRPTQATSVRLLFRNIMAFSALLFVMLWSLPLFTKLILLGRLTAPLPLGLLTVFIALAVRTAFKTHHALEAGFKTTFLGKPD